MGRAEVGTPKYIANKMKSKGLQRLRWYCQGPFSLFPPNNSLYSRYLTLFI